MTLAMASEPNSADCGPRTISMRSRSPAARLLNSNLPPGSLSGSLRASSSYHNFFLHRSETQYDYFLTRRLSLCLKPGNAHLGAAFHETWLFELEMPQRIGEGAFDFSAIWLQQTHGCARDRGAVRIENGSGNLSLLSPNGEREDT